jgi:hypothetical protein
MMLGLAWSISEGDVTFAHLEQFIDLWTKLNGYNFDEDVEDSISWTLTEDGHYTAASAYKAQFLAPLPPILRGPFGRFGHLKVKFFAWFALQNRLWTADRLQKRG